MKYLLTALLLVGCATQPVAPVEEKTPVQEAKCIPGTFCWVDLVNQKITPNMLAANVSSFCPKYKALDRKEVWLNVVKSIAYAESAWNPNETYTESTMGKDPVTGKQIVSEGLLQISYVDSRNWASLPGCKAIDYGKRNIQDPIINLTCGMEIMDRLAGRDTSRDISDRKSLGAYWSTVWVGKTKARAKMLAMMPNCK